MRVPIINIHDDKEPNRFHVNVKIYPDVVCLQYVRRNLCGPGVQPLGQLNVTSHVLPSTLQFMRLLEM